VDLGGVPADLGRGAALAREHGAQPVSGGLRRGAALGQRGGGAAPRGAAACRRGRSRAAARGRTGLARRVAASEELLSKWVLRCFVSASKRAYTAIMEAPCRTPTSRPTRSRYTAPRRSGHEPPRTSSGCADRARCSTTGTRSAPPGSRAGGSTPATTRSTSTWRRAGASVPPWCTTAP
jgi:hypothetical protein